MLLNLTDQSSESLQSQIIRQVRAKILSGELSAETNLPSIRKLARQQHVSVITVQRAYEELERENLIHSRRGKGFFVSEIRDNKKKIMAKERLTENLEFPVLAALAEGLSPEDVREVVERVLEKIKDIRKEE